MADARPFVDIHRIVDRLNDDRVWVFAEWIGQEFMPKQDNQWVAGYHERLYNLTDDAIRVCPPNTDWVVVTNGDNEYGTDFIRRVVDESANETSPDIVSFDFYSRFQRITMPACERFAAVGGSESKRMPYCKKNTRSWCQSDLGAAALNWERLIREERCFGDLKSEARGLDAEHADGLMMEALVADGWKVRHISDSCLFVHSPSIQSCAWSGGVWDDRDLILNPGGRCITGEEANEILARAATNGDNDVEEVMVSVSNDGNVESLYMNASQPHLEKVRCLRNRNAYSKDVWGTTMLWYSEHCVDDFDMGRYRSQLHEFFPTIEAVQQGRALAEGKALRAVA